MGFFVWLTTTIFAGPQIFELFFAFLNNALDTFA